jgi:hypothetical protein
VHTLDAGGAESADSNIDLATSVIFAETITPAPPGPPVTVKYSHFNELLTAVNAVRALAGASYPAIAFTTPAPALHTKILGAHITDLRNGLDQARAALGLPALTYTDPVIYTPPSSSPTLIKAAHVTELRDGVK